MGEIGPIGLRSVLFRRYDIFRWHYLRNVTYMYIPNMKYLFVYGIEMAVLRD